MEATICCLITTVSLSPLTSCKNVDGSYSVLSDYHCITLATHPLQLKVSFLKRLSSSSSSSLSQIAGRDGTSPPPLDFLEAPMARGGNVVLQLVHLIPGDISQAAAGCCNEITTYTAHRPRRKQPSTVFARRLWS